MPSSRCTATTMPPLAVPSSLVSTMPVTVTACVNTRACTTPFWPVVASSTSSVSSTGPCFSTTRLTLPSSSIRPVLVCRRPAVSTSTVSTPSALPRATASKATLAGSPPSGPRTVDAPTRSPQVCSWSAAAARKVSAAPSTTLRPSATSTRASLPQVVVLPVPLTPTTSTHGRRAVLVRQRAQGAVGVGADRADELLAQQRPQLADAAHAVDAHAGAQPGDQLGRGGHAHVGRQQRVLDLLPGVLVEDVPREQGEQAAAQRRLRARQPGAQAVQAPGGGRRHLEHGPDDLGVVGEHRGVVGQVDDVDAAQRRVARHLGVVAGARAVVDAGTRRADPGRAVAPGVRGVRRAPRPLTRATTATTVRTRTATSRPRRSPTPSGLPAWSDEDRAGEAAGAGSRWRCCCSRWRRAAPPRRRRPGRTCGVHLEQSRDNENRHLLQVVLDNDGAAAGRGGPAAAAGARLGRRRAHGPHRRPAARSPARVPGRLRRRRLRARRPGAGRRRPPHRRRSAGAAS